jgi:hypothetical protein
MSRDIGYQTAWAAPLEKTCQIQKYEKGRYVAGDENATSAHLNLESSLQRRGNGYDLKAAFLKC